MHHCFTLLLALRDFFFFSFIISSPSRPRVLTSSSFLITFIMSDPTLYLYTSLTAGSSHIVTATARVETILKANKLPFRAIDVATDEAARKLWGRRSKGKKLPGLVKYGNIIGVCDLLNPPPRTTAALTPLPTQDLEEIEEWNEFGELRMVVNSAQDVDGMPATSHPLPTDSQPPASTPKEPEPTTPKPSTIKIQSPPATRTEEKKDDQTVLALRQASEEAAAKAKSKSDKPDEKESQEEEPSQVDSSRTSRGHRGSVAPEMPDTTPDSPAGPKRPPLVPEVAAVSSANFHADNAEMLGLVEHHRGSIISATDKEEQDKVVNEIRSSISGSQPTGDLDALRKEAAQKPSADTIDEESPSEEKTDAKDLPIITKQDTAKEEEKKAGESTAAKEGEITATQDPKSAEDATKSVQD